MLLFVLDLRRYTIAAIIPAIFLYKHSVWPLLTAFFNIRGFLKIDGFKSKRVKKSLNKNIYLYLFYCRFYFKDI